MNSLGIERILCCILLLSACLSKNIVGGATVRCGNLQRFSSQIGTVNSPHFSLGAVVGLNPESKHGFAVTNLSPTDQQKTTSAPVAKESETFASATEVTFTGDIPALVQAQLTTKITAESSVEGTNVTRVSVSDVPAMINPDSTAIDRIASFMNTNPTAIVMVISTLVFSDSLAISLKNASGSSASANVMQYGNYSINVTYQCSDVLSMQGTQFGAFFKPTFLKYDREAKQVAIDASVDPDLSSYDLGAAMPHETSIR